MRTVAVVVEQPRRLVLDTLDLPAVREGDILVDVAWTGISTGTEKLLWSGRMPHFPGMGYPLVPGYETVGRVREAGAAADLSVGDLVFVPGANCYGEIKGLFGGAASRLVVPWTRVVRLDEAMGERGILIALAATAHHAAALCGEAPELIVGHGTVGRLLARIAIATGGPAPTVWERDPARIASGGRYPVVRPEDDPRRDYRTIIDASGDSTILDTLIARTAKGGQIVLAGFYEAQLGFSFAPAFMRETRIRVAAEWTRSDIEAVMAMVRDGRLDLDGLVTHHADAADAAEAYRTAFDDGSCLKMVLDWRDLQ